VSISDENAPFSETSSSALINANGPDKSPQYTLRELETIAKNIRRNIIRMITEANSGHPGGSLSAVEILTALYFQVLRHKPNDPSWSNRDRFVLSKAHACPVLYATLSEAGYFPSEELMTFRKINSRLQGHAHVKTPGVEMSGGSLGQGLSFGIGSALASKLDGRSTQTYVLLGDGECDEGQIWEAAMSAAHYKLDNLVALIDRNGIQNDRWTYQVMNLEPLSAKWSAFGWHILEIDGHDISQVIDALNEAKLVTDRPTMIIAKTIKGKGVSFMENNPNFHGKAPSKEQSQLALNEIG
jgi:transketolase